MDDSAHAGGAAMAGGQRFQAQVTAWWCARILLQTRSVGQPFDLPATSIAERVYCETTDSVDDIRIGLTNDERVFGQCKRSLNLSSDPNREWASVLIQFYHELERYSTDGTERRFVLFYERQNSNLDRLGAVLNRYRHLPIGTPLIAATTNKVERELVKNLNALLDGLQSKPELPHLAELRERLLQHAYIKQLHLGVGDADYLGIIDTLQEGLLAYPEQVGQVLNSLHRLADDLLADRGSRDRVALRRRLQGEGIILQDSVDYRSDLKRLDNWSATQIAAHEAEERSKLTIANQHLSISRAVIPVMGAAIRTTSFLVVGEPGAGKTGCLLTLASRLGGGGQRVWYWAADSLPYPSSQEIGTHLQLQHPWAELFAEVSSGAGATLIIDGLDGLRDTYAQRAYRDLFALAIRSGIRVVASIRAFDLQYAVELRETFPSPAQPIALQFWNEAFKDVSHIIIPELDDAEFAQVLDPFPLVQTVLRTAPQLQPVVRNLFSLDLLCKLMAEGDSAADLSAISTQAQLFERYWNKRVNAHQLRDAMTQTLHEIVEQMVAQQTLQVVPSTWSSQVKDALFSSGLVRHPPTAPGRLPEQTLVEFNHHLLFDYAAEILFVRPRRRRLAVELSSVDTWGIFLRPSLVLFHRYAWNYGRLDFWETQLELERSAISVLLKLPGHLVVAEEARRGDLQPLLEGCLRDEANSFHWVRITQGVITAATFSALPWLFNAASGDWWIEFARDLISTGSPQLVYAGRQLLFVASDALPNLSDQARLLLNETAVALVNYHWNEDVPPNHIIRPAIEWLCLTIAYDLSASSAVIRKILTQAELQRAGYIQAVAVADKISAIWRADPSLAVEVYDAIFGYLETDQSVTPLGGNLILQMTSNRSQDYGMAHYVLSERFPEFLSVHPPEATRALIRVLGHYGRNRYQAFLPEETPQIERFSWNGHECRLWADDSHMWAADRQHPDHTIKMLQAWEDFLTGLPASSRAHEQWEAVAAVIINDNELAAIWSGLLGAAAHAPAFYVQRLWIILLNPVILAEPATQEAATSCLGAFAPYLSEDNIRQLESAILGVTRQLFIGRDPAAIEQYVLSLKATLLRQIPENKQSSLVKAFLAEHDQELSLSGRREDFPIRWRSTIADDEWPILESTSTSNHRYKELLGESAFLERITTKEITDSNLEDILRTLSSIEQRLVAVYSASDRELALVTYKRLIHGSAQIACSEAKLDELSANQFHERFKTILFASADDPPKPKLEQFDQSLAPAWDSLDPQVYATMGVVCLAAKIEVVSPEYKDTLLHLARHPEPIMRYHLGIRIWSFLTKWPEFVWETLERWVDELPLQAGTLGVLRGTLRDSWFWWLHNRDAGRAEQLLRHLWLAARVKNATELRRASATWITAVGFFKESAWARDLLNDWVSSARENLDELEGSLHVAVNTLFPKNSDDRASQELQQPLIDFLVSLLRAVNRAVTTYWSELARLSPDERPTTPAEWSKQAGRFFEHTAMQFFFSAKGLAEQCTNTQSPMRNTLITTWLETVEPILDAVLEFPYPGITFHLIEGLEHLFDLDVERNLRLLRKVTLASAPAGLTNESLAADHTIAILEQILAEHRASLAAGSAIRTDFMQILEAYLQVGWPKAMRLAVRLESIFR